MKVADRPNLKVDSDRLWSSLMELAQIGGTEKGGVCRIALTDLDRQGRDLFVRWAKQAGCSIKVDQLGNIFAPTDRFPCPIDERQLFPIGVHHVREGCRRWRR